MPALCIPFKSHNNSVKSVLLLSPFLQVRKLCYRKLHSFCLLCLVFALHMIVERGGLWIRQTPFLLVDWWPWHVIHPPLPTTCYFFWNMKIIKLFHKAVKIKCPVHGRYAINIFFFLYITHLQPSPSKQWKIFKWMKLLY